MILWFQLQLAVNRGLINVNLLNHHAQNQPVLVELHKRVVRYFEKVQKAEQMQRQSQQIPKVRELFLLNFRETSRHIYRLACFFLLFSTVVFVSENDPIFSSQKQRLTAHFLASAHVNHPKASRSAC